MGKWIVGSGHRERPRHGDAGWSPPEAGPCAPSPLTTAPLWEAAMSIAASSRVTPGRPMAGTLDGRAGAGCTMVTEVWAGSISHVSRSLQPLSAAPACREAVPLIGARPEAGTTG